MHRLSTRAASALLASLAILGCQPNVSDGTGGGGEGGGSGHHHDGCDVMVEAFCKRFVDCGMQEFGSLEECKARQTLGCEVNSVTKGAEMDVEALVACASALDQASCDEVGSFEVPACQFHGSLPAGAGCAIGVQCASGLCSGEPSACGVCLTPVTEGEACVNGWSVPGPAPPLCGDGLYCDLTSMRCKKLRGRGDACEFLDAPCGYPFVCIAGHCHERLGSGIACSDVGDGCDGALGLQCDPSSKRCAKEPARPGPGSTCETFNECAFGSFCDPSNTCKPAVADGAACSDEPCIPPAECIEGHCQVAVDACP